MSAKYSVVESTGSAADGVREPVSPRPAGGFSYSPYFCRKLHFCEAYDVIGRIRLSAYMIEELTE